MSTPIESILERLTATGMTDEEARTSMVTILGRLMSPPTPPAEDALAALGLSIATDLDTTAAIAFLDVLRDALTPVHPFLTRHELLAALFGQDAVRAASVLTESEWRRLEREHVHFRGCIHNMPPEEQIEARGKTVEWWMRVVGAMPAQITEADYGREPLDLQEHITEALADREALALLDDEPLSLGMDDK